MSSQFGHGGYADSDRKALKNTMREKSLEIAEKMRENTFDFNDFIDQLDQVQGMGTYGRLAQADSRYGQ